jgi:hypothetical protein
VLVVELERNESEEGVTLLQRQLDWARLTDTLVVAEIPVDTRHNAKVDYPALRAMLKRRSAGHHYPSTSS